MRGNRQERSIESRAVTSKSALKSWGLRRKQKALEAREDTISIYDVDYKIGIHGFVFYLLDGEWIKSGISPDRLMRQHRMSQNESI